MDTDEQNLRVELMTTQIETLRAERKKLDAEAERFRQEMHWEPWKALAAILVGVAALTAAVVGLATWLAPHLH
jgi:hypothetical protein